MSRAELIRLCRAKVLTTEGFYYIEPRTLKKAKQGRHISNTRCEHVDIRATVLSKKSYIEYIYCKFEVQGPVVQSWFSVNPGLKFNSLF